MLVALVPAKLLCLHFTSPIAKTAPSEVSVALTMESVAGRKFPPPVVKEIVCGSIRLGSQDDGWRRMGLCRHRYGEGWDRRNHQIL